MKFVVRPPAGQIVFLEFDLWFTPTNGSAGTNSSLGQTVSFQGLEGTAPRFSDFSWLADDNRYLRFQSYQTSFDKGFAFTEISVRIDYVGRQTGLGPIEFLPVLQTFPSYHQNEMFLHYQADGPSDPGPFVFLVRPVTLSGMLDAEGFFKLIATGEPGKDVIVEASDDLDQWAEAVMLPNPTGTVEFVDTSTASWPHRFFRAKTLD
ncbi:MAG: hypothetical protein KA118_04185 [Verrucomicrobia bacterium]|nr:hypothetical protein [Verrucomicrobiota bacterium]